MATTVLLVEDDPDDSRLIVKALKEIQPDLDVLVEQNGVDAVLYFKGEARFADRKKYPVPDVILLDLGLPLLDGYEFLRWLRKKGSRACRHLPVIVITGETGPEVLSRACLLGATSVIIKPTDWNEFKEALRRLGRFWPGTTNPQQTTPAPD